MMQIVILLTVIINLCLHLSLCIHLYLYLRQTPRTRPPCEHRSRHDGGVCRDEREEGVGVHGVERRRGGGGVGASDGGGGGDARMIVGVVCSVVTIGPISAG
jgi:hypothetical protein